MIPQVNLNILRYSNGVEVYPWVRRSMIYDGAKWRAGDMYVNYNRYSFVSNTNTTGTVSGVVYCEGAIVPYRAISVSQRLNVQ